MTYVNHILGVYRDTLLKWVNSRQENPVYSGSVDLYSRRVPVPFYDFQYIRN